MDSVAITPNNYLPKYNNDTQQYEDQYIFNFSNGIQCPCSSTVFYKRCNWSSHIRTQRHSRWLTSMNTTNYYEECLELRKTVRNQQELLTRKENEINQLRNFIHHLLESQQNTSSTTEPQIDQSYSYNLVNLMD